MCQKGKIRSQLRGEHLAGCCAGQKPLGSPARGEPCLRVCLAESSGPFLGETGGGGGGLGASQGPWGGGPMRAATKPLVRGYLALGPPEMEGGLLQASCIFMLV